MHEIIEGVKLEKSKALDELYLFLNNGRTMAAITKQGFNKFDAEDIFFDAFEIFERKIKNGKFVLTGNEEDLKNRNSVQKYFLAQISGCITAIRRGRAKVVSISDTNALGIVDESIVNIEQLSIIGKTMELIKDIGTTCEKILTYSLVNSLSNKEIAKLAISPELQNTPQITERKANCLKKLYDNLINGLSQFNEAIKNDYLKIAYSTIATLEEPCKMILQLHFGGKNNQLIAATLQESLPSSLVNNLTTGDQVKKKKTRCLEGYRVSILQHILNPN